MRPCISIWHTVPEFRSTQIYSERFFLYISSCIHHRILKFCVDIHLGKNNISTKFDYFPRSLRADVEKKPLRINLGWAKFWNRVDCAFLCTKWYELLWTKNNVWRMDIWTYGWTYGWKYWWTEPLIEIQGCIRHFPSLSLSLSLSLFFSSLSLFLLYEKWLLNQQEYMKIQIIICVANFRYFFCIGTFVAASSLLHIFFHTKAKKAWG